MFDGSNWNYLGWLREIFENDLLNNVFKFYYKICSGFDFVLGDTNDDNNDNNGQLEKNRVKYNYCGIKENVIRLKYKYVDKQDTCFQYCPAVNLCSTFNFFHNILCHHSCVSFWGRFEFINFRPILVAASLPLFIGDL